MKPKFSKQKLFYKDLVTEDTPVILRDLNGSIIVKTIDDLTNTYFKREDGKETGTANYQVWSATGWNNIKQVIRHEVDKNVYRVNTPARSVGVTKDHSLIDHLGNTIKPTQCKLLEAKLSTTSSIKEAPFRITLDKISADIFTSRSINEQKAFV